MATSTNLETLTSLVEFMRKNRVTHLKAHGVELHLSDFTLNVAPSHEVVPDSPTQNIGIREEPRRGADGLTSEEQIELYGRPMADTR